MGSKKKKAGTIKLGKQLLDPKSEAGKAAKAERVKTEAATEAKPTKKKKAPLKIKADTPADTKKKATKKKAAPKKAAAKAPAKKKAPAKRKAKVVERTGPKNGAYRHGKPTTTKFIRPLTATWERVEKAAKRKGVYLSQAIDEILNLGLKSYK